MSRKNELLKKCRKIKLIISDVDGVLTDGGMYYSKTGEVMKKFNAKDGMGVELLRKKIWDSEKSTSVFFHDLYLYDENIENLEFCKKSIF